MNVFDTCAKLVLDTKDYDSGMQNASDKANVFAGVLQANLVTKGIGMAVEGLKKLGQVAVDTFKQSISEYANYEQLIGGTKLAFGDAYDFIIGKSEEAYKTVQMSQSEYLQQVNGLAVGLKESLGGSEQAAAELADRIVNAQADVVAAMGISQEAAQNAFNGIMKGNFTMVDNLMLGITPTKEGYQEMIDKVNEWNATQGRSTNYIIGNLADMQNALVDYIEMQGLAGYAQKEATDTISGSVASVKAAWKNLVKGLADDNADMDKLLDDLHGAVEKAFQKIMPVAEKALMGLIDLVMKGLPKFVDLGLKIGEAIVKGILMGLAKIALAPVLAIAKPFLSDHGATFSGRAAGGHVTAGQTYWVGEKGIPELFTPTQSGDIHTMDDVVGNSFGRQIVFNIGGDVYDDEESMKRKLRNAVIGVFEEQVSYG